MEELLWDSVLAVQWEKFSTHPKHLWEVQEGQSHSCDKVSKQKHHRWLCFACMSVCTLLNRIVFLYIFLFNFEVLMILYCFGVGSLLVPTSCNWLPYWFCCSNPAKPQAVPFVPLTAGVSHLCVSLTRKSCQHAAYPSVEKWLKHPPPTPFVFDHCAPVCSVPFSVVASRSGGSLKRQTKVAGSMFTLSDKKGRARSDSAAKTAACLLYTPSALLRHLPVSFSFPLFLPLSPQGRRHLKGLYLGVRPTKALCWISSICVWITLEPQIKKCWTRRVRSCGIYHCGFCSSLLV